MSERDQDHWQSLLSQLGADPQPLPARPARKQTTEEPRRTVAAPRVVPPPATDWTQVAKELGVGSAEPLATEVLKRRISDDAQWVEAVREAAEAVALEPEKARPPRERLAGERHAEERSIEERSIEERHIERSARETPPPDEPSPLRPAPSGGFGKGIFETELAEPPSPPVEAPPPTWLEEVEEEPQDKPRRRRRRGRSKPAARESVEEGSPAEASADQATEPRDSTEGPAPTSEAEERPRRRRRRRGRRDEGDKPRRDAAPGQATEAPQADEALDEEALDDSADVLASENHEPLEPAADGTVDDDDQPRDEAEHRNIPSWEEAIGVIIGKNMEARQKSPGGYRPRGRPRGRG